MAGPVGSYRSWADVPIGEQNLLNDLKERWGQLVGFAISPTDAQMLQVANANTTDLEAFGYQMAIQTDTNTVPWAQWGKSRDEYAAAVSQLSSTYKSLTGQDLPSTYRGTWNDSYGTLADALRRHLTAGEFSNAIQADTEMQKTYGWLKHGLDYQSFQQQKVQMRQAFGHDLSDAEAVTQLDYFHRAAANSQSVSAQPATSAEKKQAQQGVGMSIAR